MVLLLWREIEVLLMMIRQLLTFVFFFDMVRWVVLLYKLVAFVDASTAWKE